MSKTSRNRSRWIPCVAMVAMVAMVSCLKAPRLDEGHCANNDGDAYCESLDPAAPYCVQGSSGCAALHNVKLGENGCVVMPPEAACHALCGLHECLDQAESSSSGSTSSEQETSTGDVDSSSSTGGICNVSDDCDDPARPFCLEGICGACSDGEQPDVLCASLDSSKPYCREERCAECSPSDSTSCSGDTPICDPIDLVCIPCVHHESCDRVGSPACDVGTGRCFDPEAVTEISLINEGVLEEAIAAVEPDQSHTLVITGNLFTPHSVVVDDRKRIAFVSYNNTIQPIHGDAIQPTLMVRGQGTAVFLRKIHIEGEQANAVRTEAAAHLYADASEIYGNAAPAVSLIAGTQAFFRNTIVVGLGSDAIDSSASRLDLQFVTALVADVSDHALACPGGGVTVRNSLMLSRFTASIDCDAAQLQHTAVHSGATFDADWFVDYPQDLKLVASEESEVFSSVGVWRQGDSPADIDGDARPSIDGEATYVGADVPRR